MTPREVTQNLSRYIVADRSWQKKQWERLSHRWHARKIASPAASGAGYTEPCEYIRTRLQHSVRSKHSVQFLIRRSRRDTVAMHKCSRILGR
jgi:hypothetical protein